MQPRLARRHQSKPFRILNRLDSPFFAFNIQQKAKMTQEQIPGQSIVVEFNVQLTWSESTWLHLCKEQDEVLGRENWNFPNF